MTGAATSAVTPYRLMGADGRPYWSPTPGALGGHARNRIYGRLDCPSALRWLARGHYAAHRVFFADEATARATGYRPCAVCLPRDYADWRTSIAGEPGSTAGLDHPPPRRPARRPTPPLTRPTTTANDRHQEDHVSSTAPPATPQPQAEAPLLEGLDWASLGGQLDRTGFAMTEPLLTPTQCQSIIDTFDDASAFRATVHMARVSFGEGTYRYFADPLPPLVQALRTRMYPHLAAIANRWAGLLGEDTYPTEHAELVERCAAAGQHKPTPLVLRYGPSGYNCLHQDVYGDLLFPLQVLFMLNTPDVDFTGGESVFVEQRPRQQSRPMVARPGLGQAVIFPVRNRPQQGARGYRRVQMRHGVSAVHTGNRHVLGVIFHNAR